MDALAGNPVKNILEFGCSVSICLAGRHAGALQGQHFVLEHERTLAEFIFSKNRPAFSATTIMGGTLSVQSFDGDEFYSYATVTRLPQAAKYELILVKRPEGMQDRPAGDILRLLPHCLDKEFIILLPYGDVEFDKKMSEKIESRLQTAGIVFEKLCELENLGNLNENWQSSVLR